jgi:two-component system chemotaxis response regulator CheY
MCAIVTRRREMTMLRLLIADKEKADCDAADGLFSELGFNVTISPSALDTLAQCQSALPDLLVVDAGLEGALELVAAVRLMSGVRATRILYGVSSADLRQLMAAKYAGADDFLLKPYDIKVLHALFDEMIANAAAA